MSNYALTHAQALWLALVAAGLVVWEAARWLT